MTQAIGLIPPKGTAVLPRRLILLRAIFAVVLASLPAWSGEAVAQQIPASGSTPPIYWDVIGPGVDKATVSQAETRSAAVVIQVLTGSGQASTELAAWIEKNEINRQTDGYGEIWAFDPERPDDGWSRMARVESRTGGPIELRRMIAGLTLTNYLNYKATMAAVGLRLPPATDQRKPEE
jgi:hypothetical protein